MPTLDPTTGLLAESTDLGAHGDRLSARAAEIADTEATTFAARTKASKALYERALRSMPLGVPSSFQAGDPYPIYIDHGQGSHVWDVDANGALSNPKKLPPPPDGRVPVVTGWIDDGHMLVQLNKQEFSGQIDAAVYSVGDGTYRILDRPDSLVGGPGLVGGPYVLPPGRAILQTQKGLVVTQKWPVASPPATTPGPSPEWHSERRASRVPLNGLAGRERPKSCDMTRPGR